MSAAWVFGEIEGAVDEARDALAFLSLDEKASPDEMVEYSSESNGIRLCTLELSGHTVDDTIVIGEKF